MLDKKHITVGRLKQAYELSEQEAYDLLGALLPDKVFPHALWQQAYAEFWEWSVQAASFRYQVEKPPFPNTVTLPEKHFPTQLCRAPIERFFAEITKLIEISELEKGIDYIIEATYGEGNYPFQEEKKSLFRALRQEETSHENLTRTHGPMKITSMEAVNYFCITESFFDTIIVDKAAAVLYLHSCGYSLRREVKGLTQALVERFVSDFSPAQTSESAPEPPPQAPESVPQPPNSMAIYVPRSLWEGKSNQAIRNSMREQDFSDPVIAFVLYEWRGLRNKTEIGRLLDPDDGKVDSTYLRLANGLLAAAKGLNIQPA